MEKGLIQIPCSTMQLPVPHTLPGALLTQVGSESRAPALQGTQGLRCPEQTPLACTHQLLTQEAVKMLDPSPESQTRFLLRDHLSNQRGQPCFRRSDEQ